MFATYFDGRFVSNAQNWFDAGQPALVPIYVRNKVAVGLSLGSIMPTGEPVFRPVHDEFILVDGQESVLEENKPGWVKDYQLCVNPATWPTDPNSEEGLNVLLSVDPTIPVRLTALIAEKGVEVRKCRVDSAARKAFEDWHKQSLPSLPNDAEECGHRNGRLSSAGLTYTDNGAWVYPAHRFARYEEGKSGGHLYYGCLKIFDHGLSVGETSELGSISAEKVKKLSPDDKYRERLWDLMSTVESAKEVARTASLDATFPTGIKPIEKGYPKAQMPAKLELSHGAGTLRSIGSISRHYDVACKMAEALGYQRTSHYSSGTGRTESSTWVLPGQADPKEIAPAISRVDYQRGVLYAPKDKVGRVIGRGGETIRQIEKLTGRRWKVQGE